MREKWGKKKVRQIETGKEDEKEAKGNGKEGSENMENLNGERNKG